MHGKYYCYCRWGGYLARGRAAHASSERGRQAPRKGSLSGGMMPSRFSTRHVRWLPSCALQRSHSELIVFRHHAHGSAHVDADRCAESEAHDAAAIMGQHMCCRRSKGTRTRASLILRACLPEAITDCGPNRRRPSTVRPPRADADATAMPPQLCSAHLAWGGWNMVASCIADRVACPLDAASQDLHLRLGHLRRFHSVGRGISAGERKGRLALLAQRHLEGEMAGGA
ncbi:uncharacterized protein LAESUDRAFT_387278 [Laetiporus sulphureus 93-53]|uniref:Uncharacterized protein n=1 Tax=Laetiporus sulphureus 93-53 TaxID=1314785 RepID=A0A165CKH3_9APHY|nr:uncharacterized protein LAESUDRAFT_387278 [Laetiporus sulphureus 93-53]KZT02977.1 hypothetical protein LAESUDRAFT_387278 [Laetiporus sulphureus 93-53]